MSKFKATITVALRSGILDVQGKTVEQALHGEDYRDISNVRIGKHVELFVEADNEDNAFSKVDTACKSLIANPIMENYSIKVEQVNGAEA